ncbi:MAG: DNA mismatch repair endonuclease MutL [Prevotellaceae bacterium]|jgi:DNA mismatch repair protein MutL|nr:DNA mismatch repair endonuclease MutL [Prevotellaceae bacterium]
MIQLLPDYIANQIAAGEVVQRPASVVKELLENAIDAGATSITVVVSDAGSTLIQITDNGCGMSPSDARMSFERHATSKIQHIDDLHSLHTFGFRGEALASIAAVAEITMMTRRADDEVGTQVHLMAGEPAQQTPAAVHTGTSISVKNLFYNVPARRKFLKSETVELKHIVSEFLRVALCRPEVEMKLYDKNNELYHLTPSTLRQRIVNLMGKNLNQQLIDVQVETSMVNIRGFIGKPESARRNSGNQFFFANRRYFRSPYLQKAIISAYDKLLVRSPDTFPTYFIYFEIPPANIDVNIHPAKTEIKFADESVIFQMLNAAVRETLSKFAVAPSIDFDTAGAPEFPVVRKNTPAPAAPKIDIDPHFNPFEEEEKKPGTAYHKEKPIDSNWKKLYEGLDAPAIEPSSCTPATVSLSFIQVKGKYLLTPVKSGVMLIDIRRARQRIYYEEYIHRLANHQYASQQQVFPESVELRPEDCLLLEPVLEELRLLGYDITPLGNHTMAINGLPPDLAGIDMQEWIQILLEELHHTAAQLKERRQTTLAASLAKTAAGYTAETLKPEEAQALIDRLFACETPSICPAGKPVMHIIPIEELDKKLFKN